MGRKGGFITAVKRVVSCGSKQKRLKRNQSSEKWLEQLRSTDLGLAESSIAPPVAAHSPVEVEVKEAEDEHNRHAYSVAYATAVAAEAAVAAAQAAAEVVRLTSSARHRTKEEAAAIKIQTAFRGYMARRALRALKGLVRLKTLVGGQSSKRQSNTTLKCMQTMARVQFEVRARRIKMSEANSSLQRQIQQKHDKELEKLQGASTIENWDDSTRSKEQVEANFRGRQEAAVRRERALAYAYSHQQSWRNPTNTAAKQTFMDPNNPRWGWSWLERWMAARPWDNNGATTIDSATDHASVKSSASRSRLQSPKPRPPSRQSPSTPTSKSLTRRIRPASPGGSTNSKNEDSKSINSIRSVDRCHRRHSIAGSSMRDDESLASCPAGSRRYMMSTESTRAKARPPSPLGSTGKSRVTLEKASSPGSAVKKRLSFSVSPDHRPRRHSGPPKVDISPVKDATGVTR